MTYRISKIVLERCALGDFAARAATHAVAMKEWRAHMARVKEDEANGVTGIEKHMGHPRPMEHELVEAAVNENDEMDYEIVDDGPTPDQVLRGRKDDLLAEVARAEHAALETIAPAGKRRLLNIRHDDIRTADRGRALKILQNRSKLSKAATAVGLLDPIDIDAEVAKMRPAEETELLEQISIREQRFAVVQRLAAQASHDIEDLTIDSINDWKMPDFKEIK